MKTKEDELNKKMDVDMTWNEYFEILNNKVQEGSQQTLKDVLVLIDKQIEHWGKINCNYFAMSKEFKLLKRKVQKELGVGE